MELKEVENKLRDLINWVSVFDTEYDLPNEVKEKLQERLYEIANDLGFVELKKP